MRTLRTLPDESRIWIEARSSLHPVRGEASGLEGEAQVEVRDGRFDLSTPPVARLEFPVEKLNSGSDLQDNEMQRRIEARKYPTIAAELRSVTPLAGLDRYRLLTDLTFHGVTRRLEVDVTGRLNQNRVSVEGEFSLDVRAFDVVPPSILGLKVHPDILVRVHMVLA
jgi:hypothetical protein